MYIEFINGDENLHIAKAFVDCIIYTHLPHNNSGKLYSVYNSNFEYNGALSTSDLLNKKEILNYCLLNKTFITNCINSDKVNLLNDDIKEIFLLD